MTACAAAYKICMADDLTRTEQHIALWIAGRTFNDDCDGFTVDQAEIARKTKTSVRSVQRALNGLKKKGYIVWIRKAGETLYQFPQQEYTWTIDMQPVGD